MKKLILSCVVFFQTFLVSNVKTITTNYYCKSYIVLDYNSGKILEGKDIHLIRSVASISKIMTAIVAIENSDLNNYVEVEENIKKGYGSSIYLQEKEIITMKDLLYGLMLRSGNDAALTIAVKVANTEEEFVEMMNTKAKIIGMNNTTFHNPSGLDVDDEGNLSTSYDMALLMKYAMENETFKEITSTVYYKSENHGTWLNKNRLLREYKNTIGGKTGFTTKARRTLVTSAKQDDNELIIVTLDCGGDFSFHKQLYEKYFSNYKTFKLLNKGSNYIEDYELVCEKPISIILKKEEIGEYKIIYEVGENKANIIVQKNDDKKIIGNCEVNKKTNKKVKKSLFRRIIEWFKK